MKTGERLLTDRAKAIGHISQLNPTALSVIGLWHMGVTDVATIAHVMGCKERRIPRLKSVMKELKRSKNPLVREWVDHALPPGVYAQLNFEQLVWCELCHNTVNMVPCPVCSTRGAKRAK